MKKLLLSFIALLCLGSMTIVQAGTWTPAGTPASVFGSEWAPNTPDNDMTLLSGNVYKFTKDVNFSSNTSISFKVCKDHAWTTAYPSSNYGYTVLSGSHTLLITFNSSTKDIQAFTTMTVAGDNSTLFGDTWSPSTAANDMTLQSDGTYKFEKEHVTLGAGTINFKACADHAWTRAWPGSNYQLSIPESGDYTITITFDPATLSVSATADLEQPVVVIPTIQLHSNITNPSWETSADFTVAANEETASLTLTNVTKGDYEFGIKIDGTWTSNGSAFTRANNSYAITSGSGNCTFNADRNGDYTFTWTYATNTLTVAYPALPAQSVTLTPITTPMLKGTEVTFTATSSGIDNPGYRFYVKEKNGIYGSAVTSYAFNTLGEFTVKVEALEDNTGDPVATDEQDVVVYDAYTFTNGTTIYVDFTAVTGDKKGVNFPYGDKKDPLNYDAAGAGTFKTIPFTADVEWTTFDNFIKTEKADWAELKFSVPTAGQNCVVVAEDGASYTWGTYTPLPPTIKMHSNFTNPDWETSDAFDLAANYETATLTLNIQSKGEKEFGMRIGSDDNWTSNGASFTRDDASKEIIAGSGNCKLAVDAKGDYTFTWTYATNTLTVTYPALPAQSVTLTSIATPMQKGTEVTFDATSSGIDNPGYRFYVKEKNGSYGSAVTSYTFNTIGEFTVKVEALEDNTGDPVATDEQDVTVYDAYTFTTGTTIYVDFTAMTAGSKGVNFPKTDEANLEYDGEGAGKVKTITFSMDVTWSTSNDFIKTEEGGWDPGMKFMVPTAGQNCAAVAADGASYTWTTIAPTIKMHGNFLGDWATTDAFVIAANQETASLTITNLAVGDYNFGMRIGSDDNWTSNATAFTRDNNSAVIPICSNTGNCALNADVAGDYTFTWTFATNTLTITYPAAPPVETTYTRAIRPGFYGTICLPLETGTFATAEGATLFSVLGKTAEGLYLEPITEMVAGKPYFFLANTTELSITYTPAAVPASGYEDNGLVGNVATTYQLVTANDNNYILYDNLLYFVDSEAYVGANCAYIAWDNVSIITNPSAIPAHARMLNIHSTPTSIEFVNSTNADARKMLINGHLYIMHGHNVYDVTGQIVK